MSNITVAISSLAIASIAFCYQKKALKYPHDKVMKLLQDNYNKTELNNVVAVITGATSGIGLSLAKELYNLNATVIFASRNKNKAEKIASEIKAEYPNSSGVLDIGVLDTEDLKSVTDFASWCKRKYSSVNYLINNAGISYGAVPGNPLRNLNIPVVSKQGYDQLFVTNYMGHFLLTELLLPIITERIVNVTSGLHFIQDGKLLLPCEDAATGTVMPDAAIAKDEVEHRRAAYGASKLAQILHVKELQRRINNSSLPHKDTIKTVAVTPGLVQTSILGSAPISKFLSNLAFPATLGILAIISSLFDKTLRGGNYVSNCKYPLRQFSWFDSMTTGATRLGIRKGVILLLGLYLSLTQSFTYGYHKDGLPSLESRDPVLAANLYKWTRNELVEKGYLDK